MVLRPKRPTRREPKPEVIAALIDPAGDCPAGGNPFLHLSALPGSFGYRRDGMIASAWPLIIDAYLALNRETRRKVRNRRRQERIALRQLLSEANPQRSESP